MSSLQGGSIPMSCNVVETAVIFSNTDIVWNLISNFNFTWWDLVDSVAFENGGCPKTIGSHATFKFKDGLTWTVEIVEFSSLKKSITFEVVHCDPPLPFTSVIQTISLSKVTLSNETFIQWISDFSNDATAEVMTDNSYKKLDAFKNLQSVCQELQYLSSRVNDIEARSRSNSLASSPRSRSNSLATSPTSRSSLLEPGSPRRTQGGHVNFST